MFRKVSLLAAAAALCFFPLFLLGGLGRFDFWWWMSAAVAAVAGLGFALDKSYAKILADDWKAGRPEKILLGTLTAVLLYAAFAGLNYLSRLIFASAGADIGRVYAFKEGASPARVGLLIMFLIGPGEEIIWRGFIQRHWQKRWGFPAGWLLAAALYAAVHAGSGNAMLVLAAAAAGLFWGFLYHRFGSVLLNAVSHTLWDLLIFVIFPLTS
ncbi:MAG: hypothetical protein A2W03_01965 [Candidatus Aminicenantes bacterium RBG_16_63_16]|nr:MAG: hypothetical protein A2W03_01965 [Candidatus Aminicenantes bacterium RBG_16_63_16]